MKNQSLDIIIIGAGASGLMAGALLENKNVVILEGSSKIGAKILVSGGGRCNITNQTVEPSHYVGNPFFIQEVLKQFDQYDLLAWLKERNLEPILRKEHQYFCKNSSKELLDILKRENLKNKIELNQKVISITRSNNEYEVTTQNRKYKASKVVIATGGLSYPLLGADDIGYRVAQSFGHTITKTSPALVGFTVQKEQFFFKSLSGVSTEVIAKVANHNFFGSLLFVHRGVSGPAILNASLYWEKGKLEINFLPHWNHKTHLRSQKNISSILPMPKSVSKAFLEHLQIPDIPLGQLKTSDKEKLESLKNYQFAPAGTFGYSKAEVTKGGIQTDAIDSKTMMSKKSKNLYFIGEVVDVTGWLGGYNFQWAFSSAFVCAQSLSNEQ